MRDISKRRGNTDNSLGFSNINLGKADLKFTLNNTLLTAIVGALQGGPRVKAQIMGYLNALPMPMLIDTGSDMTLASESLRNIIKVNSYPTRRYGKGISGTGLDLREEAQATLQLGSHKREIVIYFSWAQHLQTRSYEALIGTDSLVLFPPFSMDFANKIFSIGNSLLPLGSLEDVRTRSRKVCLSSHVVLPPMTETIVECTLTGRTLLPTDEYAIFESSRGLAAKLVMLTPTVLGGDSSCHLLLTNATQQPIELYKGMTMGHAEFVRWDQSEVSTFEAANIDPSYKVDLSHCDITAHEKDKLEALLQEFSDVFSTSKYDIGSAKVEPQRIITTTNEPVFSKPHKVPFKFREELSKHITQLVEMGVMTPADSPWASSMLLVPKKGGELRPCIDFRKLNAVTVEDRFPIPTIETVLEKIGNCKYYSSLDLSSGYLQIPLDEDASYKCGVITLEGTYRMTHMGFGLRNATSMFARVMSTILAGINSGVLAYVDDILVYTSSDEFDEHLSILRQVFTRFRQFNLKLAPKKCCLARTKLQFLGHEVSRYGYSPADDNLSKIRNFPRPTNAKQVKSFVGVGSFYRKFIPNFAGLVEPLTRLLSKDNKFVWETSQEEAFEGLKKLLLSPPVLRFPDYAREFHLFVDASNVAQGASLNQKDDEGRYYAIMYGSRVLSKSERKWPIVQTELGAIIWGLRLFRPYIFQSKVVVHTDHKPLQYLMKKREQHVNLARWVIELDMYDIEIEHINGERNKVADALSRAASMGTTGSSELPDIVDFPVCLYVAGSKHSISEEQDLDPVLAVVRRHLLDPETEIDTDLESSQDVLWYLDRCEVKDATLFKLVGDKERHQRVVVPSGLQRNLFESMHESILGGGHMDSTKTYTKIAQRYFWRNMAADVRRWVLECNLCQRRRIPRAHLRYPITAVLNDTVLARVGIDLCGPLPETPRGNKHILNMIDMFTKFVVSVPVPDTKALTLATAFVEEFVLKYSTPTQIVSDNAKTFSAEFIAEVSKLLGFSHRLTTPYHSEGNGTVERSFKTFQGILAKFLSMKKGKSFDELLNATCFAYNTSVHVTTGDSPFFLMFGRTPVMNIDVILNHKRRDPYVFTPVDEFRRELLICLRTAWTSAAEISAEHAQAMEKRANRGIKPQIITEGDVVMLKRTQVKPGQSPKFRLTWKGLFRVISIDEPHAFIQSCESPQEKLQKVHLNQIKKYLGLKEPDAPGPALTLPQLTPDTAAQLKEHGAEPVSVPGFQHAKIPEQGEKSGGIPGVARYNLRPRK